MHLSLTHSPSDFAQAVIPAFVPNLTHCIKVQEAIIRLHVNPTGRVATARTLALAFQLYMGVEKKLAERERRQAPP